MIPRRLTRCGDDEGVGIVFVLLISVMVMIMLGTATAALIAQIKPAATTVANGQAMAAAEAGIDDAAGWLNTNCGSPDGLTCTTPPTVGQQVTKTLGADSHESFTWKVIAFVAGKLRVSSIGRALGPAVSGVQPILRTFTLIGDITATPSFTNFQYYTKFETFPSDFVNSFYAPRNVQVTSTTGSSLSGPGTLRWNGTCTYVDATTTPSCDANHSTNVCEDLYFPSSTGPGRSTDSAWNNALRRPPTATQAAMGISGPYSNNFGYYSENGTFTPTSGSASSVTHNDTCDSTFEPNMIMNGPIYSQDAYLIDRGKDTGNSKNSMPIFNDAAYSMWDGTTNGVRQAVGPNGGYARAYPGTDGSISTTQSPQPVYTTDELDLPATANIAQGLATCTYTGPTRILMKQGIAYVTSPMTPTSPMPVGPKYCYTSTGNFTNANSASGAGVANAQVPVNNTIIYVANPTAGTHPVATSTTPIFSLASTVSPPSGTSPTSTVTGAWAAGAYSSTSACVASSSPLTRRNVDCEASATANNASTAPDLYTAVQQKVSGELASSVTDANLAADLKTNLKPLFAGSRWLDAAPTTMSNNDVKYVVSVTGPTAGTPSTVKPAAQTDTFYQSTAGQGYTSTPESWTLTITRYACASSGGCDTSGNNKFSSAVEMTGALSRTTTTPNNPVNTTSTWPWFGAQSGAGTYTDMNNDVTPYQTNWGDAYIQGQLTGEMTVVAEHDVVVTNDITYTNSNVNTTSDGLALVADHNARIYRPMTCTDDGTAGATTGGYCPNDLTGVYNTPLSWPLPANFPALKYQADNAPSMTGSATGSGQGNLYATVFTLRGCFMIDNFYRGATGASATVTGGLYQYHRGPTSLPYQGRPYQGSTTKMPGVTLAYTYDNMRQGQQLKAGLRVPWVPNPQNRPSTSSRTWNTVAISTGS
jgi:hypothetical protein